jgi:hypothetical protein
MKAIRSESSFLFWATQFGNLSLGAQPHLFQQFKFDIALTWK